MINAQAKYKTLDSFQEYEHYTDWVNPKEAYMEKIQSIRLLEGLEEPKELIPSVYAVGGLIRTYPQNPWALPWAFNNYTFAHPIIRPFDSIYGSRFGYWVSGFIERPIIAEFNTNQVVPISRSRAATELDSTINEARDYILSLTDNWNEEGAKSIPPKLLDAALSFLKTYNRYLIKTYRINLAIPEINPCPDGTIDFSWRTRKARMLINIRNVDDIPHAFFYGDRYFNRTPVKGNTPVAAFSEGLAAWMKSFIE